MVNNENFLLKEIPNFHPILQQYERIDFFKSIKRRIFEGYWVGGRWCPPELYYHVNLSTIQFLGGGRKVSGIGRPWFRDIEWEKAFIYSEACGFSGFIDDPEYTCLRDVQTLSKDEIYKEFCLDYTGSKIEKNYNALFTKSGQLKKYKPARDYFYRTDMDSSFGKALYLNNAKNVIDFEARGGGKSMWASSCIQHNLLTDGCRDYDEYLEGRKTKKFASVSQTLVGAIEAKYSSDLLSKVRFSLLYLPGETTIRIKGEDKTFASPLLPELIGSWEAGAKSPLRDALSGSSIVHRTFMDNPLAANGTRPTRAFIEEAGFLSSVQEILGAVEATQPNKQSNKYLPIYMLGTGGYTTTGTALWMKEIFYNPERFDCLAFDDIWENKGKIGYFLPATKSQNDFKEGPNLISNEARALESINKARDNAKKSNNKVKILTEIINQPLTPSEVFMTMNGNFFPVEDLRGVLERLESSMAVADQSYKFEFQIVDGRVISKISDKRLIREFPLKKGIDMDAPVEVWELPQRNSSGDIYAGRYIGGWDPVDVDGNDDNTQSLQSSWILDTWTDRIVAEYTARTYLASDYYEQARRMFMFYNAQCNYESNLKGPYTYFLNKNSLHLLCETPESLSDKSLVKVSSIGNKSKGTRMNNTLISYGLEELLGYLEKQAYDKPEGVRNMDTIKSPALLRELIGYSPDINCDRISALLLLMIMRADRERITQMTHNREVKSKTSDPIWKRGYKRSFNKPWNGGFDL